MKRIGLSVVLLVAVLVGCSSFNNSFNTYHLPPTKTPITSAHTFDPVDLEGEDDSAPKKHVVAVHSEPATAPKTGTPCPVSPYPPPGKFPELPARALTAVADDIYAVELIERRHIDELRFYISERRRLNREAREAFEEKCIAVVK